MKKNDVLEEIIDIKNLKIPVIFHLDRLDKIYGKKEFMIHWHNKIELLYMISGIASFRCNKTDVRAEAGDLVVINCNELHAGQTLTDVSEYYCFILDYSFFGSSKNNTGDIKYLKPIYENMILFENLIKQDGKIQYILKDLISEISEKKQGYELAIKSGIYNIMLNLLRRYAKYTVTPKEYSRRLDRLNRFDPVFAFIEEQYSKSITLDDLCEVINISRYRFCHLFKEIAGMSAIKYLNHIRIEKAQSLLDETDMTIAEISDRCGFCDPNYFCRVFKKYNGISPKKYKGMYT